MKTMKMRGVDVKLSFVTTRALLPCVLLAAAGCAPATKVTVERTDYPAGPVARARPQLGVVDAIWEEPMTDVVDVPPGLDPEGHYYRPAHQEVIEIRQGRWKYYRSGGSR